MAAFDLALSRVRAGSDDLLLPTRIDQLARAGDVPFRSTTLTPGNTLRLFAQQVAHGNVACSAVHHLAGEDFTDSAWCQARKRLPIELIRQLHRSIVDDARRELDRTDDLGDTDYRWRGHRVYVVDGTNDSMPDTPELRSHYGVPAGCREGLGFPTSCLLLVMDHRSGLLIDCVDSPMNTSDVSQTPPMHAHLSPGDILLADVAFAGWAHLALMLQANLHAVMPAHHRRIIDFAPQRKHAHPRKGKSTKRAGKPRSRVVRTLGQNDQLVEYFKPVEKPAWMSGEQWEALPESIIVREIRRTVRRHGFRPMTVTIITTLLDPEQYPADELIELRLTRWMIETNIRHLKITLGMDVLKCKTLDGVRKERLMFLLVYNLIRIVMLRAARAQSVNRLSFADTLAWLRLADMNDLDTIARLKINPLRPGRLEPRAIKRQKKEFPYMTSPRAALKAQLRAKHCDTA
jgi:Transposase DDE domain